MTTLVQQQSHTLLYDYPSEYSSSMNLDKVVELVTNATKRLSQILTNTNNLNKKRKSQNKIGPWKLGRTLGRGSTGRVRLAKNINTGQLAAVKIVPKLNFKMLENPKYKYPLTQENKDRLPYGIEREIIIMKLISHQNIMALYDVWENKNDLYLILEYIEGGELFDYLIKRGRLQEFEAINYFKQIINGISYLHQFNICHRDLKPENLLLDHHKNIKIADFGMAALEIREKLLETSCGSPHYASPEIVAGKTYHGAPSDIWSCGIILFALLTGHLPFDHENVRVLLLKVQSGKFTMPSDLSWEAKDLINKMLVVDPNKRITIDNILTHPLLTKYPPANNSGTGSELDFRNLCIHPIDLEDKIDREILKNLLVLFHNCDEKTITAKLTSQTNCPEKMFYYLLMKYRNEHAVDLSPSKGIPRSALVVKTTVYDEVTGESHTTVQKIPNSRSSQRSLKKTHSSKVLSNITNTASPNLSVRNFKALNSFNRRKVRSASQRSLGKRLLANSSSSSVNKTKARSQQERATDTDDQEGNEEFEDDRIVRNGENTSRSGPPKQEPPEPEPKKITRKLTGLLDLDELGAITKEDPPKDSPKKKPTINTLNSTRTFALPSTTVLPESLLKRKVHPDTQLDGKKGKSLLNFEKIIDETFKEESLLGNSSDTTTRKEKIKSPHDLRAHERQLAAKVHEKNEERERILRKQEELRKLKMKEEMDKKMAEEKEAKKAELLRRQSILLQERQRNAKEKLQDGSLSDSHEGVERRYVTEPVRPSLDPRNSPLVRARSMMLNHGQYRRNSNASRVLNKLGIEAAGPPRALHSNLKTSSSKKLSSYGSRDVSLQEFNLQEDGKLGEVSRNSSFGYQAFSKFADGTHLSDIITEDDPELDEDTRIDTTQDRSVNTVETRVNNTTGVDSIIDEETLDETRLNVTGASFNDTATTQFNHTVDERRYGNISELDRGRYSRLNSSRSGMIPNPHFSRISFGGLLNVGNEAGDAEILKSLQSTSGTVVRRSKDKQELKKSDSVKTSTSTTGSLKKSGTIVGLGISKGSQKTRESSKSSRYPSESTVRNDSVDDYRAEGIADMYVDVDTDDTVLDEPEINATKMSAATFADVEYSNYDLQVADVGKMNTTRPSYVENNSNESLVEEPEVVQPKSQPQQKLQLQKSQVTQVAPHESGNSGQTDTVSRHSVDRASHVPDLSRHSTGKFSRHFADNAEKKSEKPTLEITSRVPYTTKDTVDHKLSTAPSKDKYAEKPLPRTNADVSRNFEILDSLSIMDNDVQQYTRKSVAIDTNAEIFGKDDGFEDIEDEKPSKDDNPGIFKKLNLKPNREAPPAPAQASKTNRFSKISTVSKAESETTRKSNWFKKFFQALSSPKKDETTSAKHIKVINSTLPPADLIRTIKTHLELRKMEGTITSVEIDEEFGLFSGVIPSKLGHGKKLKFKIETIDLINSSSLHLMKVKGSEKGFRNLESIIGFIVRNEENVRLSRNGKATK